MVFIGVAQEEANSFKAAKHSGADRHIWFAFSRQPVAVT